MTTRNTQPDQTITHPFRRWLHYGMSPWGVSLMFHVALILLLVLLVPIRSMRGDGRQTNDIGIVFAPATSENATSHYSAESPQDQITETSVASIVSQLFAEMTPLPVIGSTQPESSGGNGSATGGQPDAATVGDAGGNGSVSVSFMGAQGTGRKFVYVLDRSASTGFGQRQSPLYVAKTELLASLQSIGEVSLRESKPIQFQVIFFNNNTAIYNTVGYGGSDTSGRLLRYDQATFDRVQRFLGGIIAEGGTLPEPALMQAVRMDADCVFFMTDGDTRLNPAQLQRIRQMAKGVQINVVEYGKGPRTTRSNSLQQLAAQNRGNHVYIDLRKRP